MRKFLWLAPVLLLAGCHSAQVALRPPAAPSEPVTTTTLPTDSAQAATVIAALPAGASSAPTASVLPRLVRPVLPARHRAALPQLLAVAKAASVAPATKRLAQHIQRQRPTEGAAESGLGRVALFFIGVVLAVLAGLAALVNVIFGVGFFTALGYTAAGLVVLFLLYSLFSGGKKKK